MEKRTNVLFLKLGAIFAGIIAASWDIGGLIANIAITYIAAKGHRTRWVAMGVLVVGLSSLLRALPYHIFGPGETAKMYTKQYGNWSNETSETWSANGNLHSNYCSQWYKRHSHTDKTNTLLLTKISTPIDQRLKS